MEGVDGATWALNGFDCLKFEVLKGNRAPHLWLILKHV